MPPSASRATTRAADAQRRYAARTRLPPGERRQALIEAAGRLLSERGVDAVQFADVAAAAGVTRQLVYRFFPNRRALVMAVLEDFADELTHRFGAGAARAVPGSLGDAARVFVEAVCDTIDVRGIGAWHLLDAKGPDAAIAHLGESIQERLVQPWHASIAGVTGASEREVTALARMIVAAGRAVLELWHGGVLTRDEAVDAASRGVTGMLRAFTRPRAVRAHPPRPRR